MQSNDNGSWNKYLFGGYDAESCLYFRSPAAKTEYWISDTEGGDL